MNALTGWMFDKKRDWVWFKNLCMNFDEASFLNVWIKMCPSVRLASVL